MMVIRSLVLALVLATPALAQSLPEPQSDTLSDFADVLDPTEEGRITRLLDEMRAATGVQMVVVTVPGIATAPGGAGQQIEPYSKALFNGWGVGGAERNDGILLVLDTEAREARIALGSGYDPVYDGRAARVLSTAVLPLLRDGQYAQGIEAGIASARDRLITPFLAGQPVSLTDGFPEEEGSSALTGLAAFGGIVAVAGYAIWRNRRARIICPNCGAPTLDRNNEIIDPPTPKEAGTGMQHLTCSACGFTDRKAYPVRYSSSEGRRDRASNDRKGGGGGSSGGGFGGGNSSGGGATGKW
jgi:uncharacterized protein